MAITDVNSVSVAQVGAIGGNLGASPDVLEVRLPLVLGEPFKHFPEPLHNLVVRVTIIGDLLESLDSNFLVAANSVLELDPAEVVDDAHGDDFLDTFLDPGKLSFTLVKKSLGGKIDELEAVGVVDILFGTAFA